jgi:hypothetical protein
MRARRRHAPVESAAADAPSGRHAQQIARDDVFDTVFDWLAAVRKRLVKVQCDVTAFIGERVQHAP